MSVFGLDIIIEIAVSVAMTTMLFIINASS